MTRRTVLLTAILVPFLAYSLWVVRQVGYLGIFQAAFANPATVQVFLDLCIACLLVSSWIVQDAGRRGEAAWPWVLGTALLGSLSPLVYLLRREALRTPDTR